MIATFDLYVRRHQRRYSYPENYQFYSPITAQLVGLVFYLPHRAEFCPVSGVFCLFSALHSLHFWVDCTVSAHHVKYIYPSNVDLRFSLSRLTCSGFSYV